VDKSFAVDKLRPSVKRRPQCGSAESDDDQILDIGSDGVEDSHGKARYCISLFCAFRDDDLFTADPSFSHRSRILCVLIQFTIGSVALGVTISGIVGPILFILEVTKSTSDVNVGRLSEGALPKGGEDGGRGVAEGSNLVVTTRPSLAQTGEPTGRPTGRPTVAPTSMPTAAPTTLSPTLEPTAPPTSESEDFPDCAGRSSLHRLEVTGWDTVATTVDGQQPHGGMEQSAASVTVTTPMLGRKKVVFKSLLLWREGSSLTDDDGSSGEAVGTYLCLRRKRCYTVVATLTSMSESNSIMVYNYGSDREPALEWSVHPVIAAKSGAGSSDIQGPQKLPPIVASGLVLPNWVGSDSDDFGREGKRKNAGRKERERSQISGSVHSPLHQLTLPKKCSAEIPAKQKFWRSSLPFLRAGPKMNVYRNVPNVLSCTRLYTLILLAGRSYVVHQRISKWGWS